MNFSHSKNLLGRTDRKIGVVLSVLALSIVPLSVAMLFPPVDPALYADEPANVDDPTLAISPVGNITIPVNPKATASTSSTDGTGTTTATVSVSTTNPTGYSLSMNLNTANSNLTNTSDNTKTIPTLSSGTYTLTTMPANTWGYSTNGTNFIPVPNSASSAADKTLATTSTATSGTDAHTLTFAAKSNLSNPSGDYTNVLTFTAVMNPVPYTLNYDANSGTGAPAAQTASATGTSYTFTVSDTIPTKTDYVFQGWCKSAETTSETACSGTLIQPSGTITLPSSSPTLTLKAIWKLNSINVTYNGNNGNFSGASTNVMTYDQPQTVTYPTVTVNGSTTTTTSATGTKKTSITDSSKYANSASYYQELTLITDAPGPYDLTIYYATEAVNWDWICVYDGTTYTPESSCTNAIAPTSNNGSTSGKKIGGGGSNKDAYVYTAKYSLTNKTARIYFRSDGSGVSYGFWAAFTGGGSVVTQNLLSGSYKTPTRSNYGFIGWGTTAAKTTSDWTYSASTIYNADTTVYALWAPTYTVSYAGAGATSGVPSAQSANHATSTTTAPTFTLSSTTPTYSGYSFKGWCKGTVSGNPTNGSCSGTMYKPSASFTPTAGVTGTTLTAVWGTTRTVEIARNDTSYGTTSKSSMTVPNGAALSVNGNYVYIGTSSDYYYNYVYATATTATGYTTDFSNWTNGCGSTVTANCTMTANFTRSANTYSISYNLDGGTSGGTQPASGTYDTGFTVSNPTKSGYTFKGWTISGMDTNTHYYGTSSSSYSTSTASSLSGITSTWFKNLRATSGTVTFTAVWGLDYSITYNDNGGSGGPGSQSGNAATVTISSTEPTLSGKYFHGWASSDTATTVEFKAGATYDVSNFAPSKTLYAVWKDEPATMYMQDVATWASQLAIGDQIQVVDRRDNKMYWVARLKTNTAGTTSEIWMTQNLDYDIKTSNNIVSLTSNGTATTWSSSYSPQATSTTLSSQTSSTGTYSWDPGNYYVPDGGVSSACSSWPLSGCTNGVTAANSLTSAAATGDTTLHYHVGNYYQYNAVTAGYGGMITSQDVSASICPTGWRLATSNSTTNNYSFGKLLTAYSYSSSSDTILRAAPLYFVRGGNVGYGLLDRLGTLGLVWSSMANSYTYSAYILSFGSSYVAPSGDSHRSNGRSARCVAI